MICKLRSVPLTSGVIAPYNPPKPIIQRSCLNYYEGYNLSKVQTCRNCSSYDIEMCETCQDPNAIPLSWQPICYCPSGFIERNETCIKTCFADKNENAPKCASCQETHGNEHLCSKCVDKNSGLNENQTSCICNKKFRFDADSKTCVCQRKGTFERNGTCVAKCNKKKKGKTCGKKQNCRNGTFRCKRCDKNTPDICDSSMTNNFMDDFDETGFTKLRAHMLKHDSDDLLTNFFIFCYPMSYLHYEHPCINNTLNLLFLRVYLENSEMQNKKLIN